MAKQKSLIPLTSSGRDALVFANTPTHLFRLLQSDPMVQYCVQMLPAEDLLEILKTWSPVTIEVPEMLLQPYTAFIALASIAPPLVWLEAKQALPELPWMKELLNLAESMRTYRTLETTAKGTFFVHTPINQSIWGEEDIVPEGVPE